MKISALLLLILLSLVNNNAFAQGTGVLTYGYQPYQPYIATPVPVAYYHQTQYYQPVQVIYPVVATGYYPVPSITYQYVPYYYVNQNIAYYYPEPRRPCLRVFRNY